jgi:catechol 2,3-dioxygenase-like lactoylglutathione lyase family enzyme
MIRAIDHIVILVDDLEEAVGDYEALGFTVTPGGEHADGATHNALVSFLDGSYLELIAFKVAAPGHRWWRHKAAGAGLIDYAVLPADTAADTAAAQARGLPIHGPLAGGRERPDGVRLQWQTAYAEAAELPFLCGDLTPRELRVPHGPAQRHSNGVSGIFRITVAVRDLEASAGRMSALLGHGPLIEPGRRLFKLGASYIALQAPGEDLPENAAIVARLERRGEGIAALALRRDHLATSPRTLDADLTHGARITIS